MRKPFRVSLVLSGGVLFIISSFFSLYPIGASADPPGDFTPVLIQTEKITLLHQTLSAQVKGLLAKTNSVLSRPAAFPPGVVEADANEAIRTGQSLPGRLVRLNHEIQLLHFALLEKRISSVDTKFLYWRMEYDAVSAAATDFMDAVSPLENENRPDPLKILETSRPFLEALTRELGELHVRFQILANILELFRQSGYKTLPAPDRVLDETWLAHEERTNHWGIADPTKPSKIFKAHSLYAIRDKNPNHDVWPCEATVSDFLQGRVKGQDHPYENSSDTPFCQRCHEGRVGKHNFPWCMPGNSQEMIKACNIIESAGGKK